MNDIAAYAAHNTGADLERFTIQRRAVGAKDIQIDIEYCGVCHSDLHIVNDDWGMSHYPVVPGHEILGTVSAVGSDVSTFQLGDTVAVGCMVDSCQQCSACNEHLEQHCLNGFTLTYGSPTRDPGGFTFGGYSKRIVVTENFVLRVPTNLDKAKAAPLLCAGITTYSPLKQYNVKPGMTVGVIGLGGLGHMGIKFSHALGAKTVMVTTSESKAKDAKLLGADEVLLSTHADQMKKWAGQFDFLLNTIPVDHDINPYIELLKYGKTMCLVGAIEPLTSISGAPLVFGRKAIAGSLIGGIQETQDMLDFCGEHNITSDIELIPIQKINDAYKRMVKNDVKYRFVIDMQSL